MMLNKKYVNRAKAEQLLILLGEYLKQPSIPRHIEMRELAIDAGLITKDETDS